MTYYFMVDKEHGSFVWDGSKDITNQKNHAVNFIDACMVFDDPDRVIAIDEGHSKNEERHFCIGKVNGKIATVRFTYRDGKIRIYGAGFWRKGKKLYEEQQNKIPKK